MGNKKIKTQTKPATRKLEAGFFMPRLCVNSLRGITHNATWHFNF